MSLRIERLWQDRRTGARVLTGGLTPLAWGLRGALAIRRRFVVERHVERPVISVGNLSVGGNGKTPLVAELCRRLCLMGRRPAVVSRGYGRKQPERIRLWAPGDPPAAPVDFGDEAVWFSLRQPQVPVVVGADRVAACRRAIEELAVDVLVCDDAFQHIRLARDLDLVAIHARAGLGNGRLLPAGPLREPVSALSRAQGLIFTYAEEGWTSRGLKEEHGIDSDLPTALCRLASSGFCRGPDLEPVDACPKKVWGVAGIARPEGFARSVQEMGLRLLGLERLRDHHRPSDRRLAGILRRAERAGAQALLCTEKDLLKWPVLDQGALPVFALRQELQWLDDGERIVDDLLEGVFRPRST